MLATRRLLQQADAANLIMAAQQASRRPAASRAVGRAILRGSVQVWAAVFAEQLSRRASVKRP